MVWAAGKNRRHFCCTSAAYAIVDMVPGEIRAPKDGSGDSVGDSMTDIELVPVETFESWTGENSFDTTSYVRM
jgi:hypothetical protein